MADAQIAIIDGDQTQVVLAPGENPAIVTSIPGPQGPAGAGVPLGGTTNQVLFKQSGTNYDTAWGPITSAMIGDLEIVNADVSASAAIAGTKISPNFGSQNVTTTGTSTAASFIPTSSTAPTNGLYLSAANSVALSTNGNGRLFIDSSGNVGLGISSFTTHGATQHVTALGGSAASRLSFYNGSTLTGDIVSANFAGLGLQINVPNAQPIQFHTNNTERLRITSTGQLSHIGAGNSGSPAVSFSGSAPSNSLFVDSSGRLGVGTTGPSATLHAVGGSTVAILQRTGANACQINVGDSNLSNIYYDADAHYFRAGNGTSRATIDSSGRLLVGTSSARSNFYNGSTYTPRLQLESASSGANSSIALVSAGNSAFNEANLIFAKSRGNAVGDNTIVVDGDDIGTISFQASDGSEYVVAAHILAEVDGTPGANDMPGRLVFSTTADGAASPTERMRINSSGALHASTSGTYLDGTATYHEFSQSNNNYGFIVHASNSSFTSSVLHLSASRNTSNSTFNYLEAYNAGSLSLRLIIRDSGNVVNVNNSYGAISDIKLKENIVNANSQWSDIKALQVRNYNFKEGQTHTQIGLIAQEVELISPGLVSESPDRDAEGNDLGTTTKSVNYSVLYMKAVKALQEAMERIEQLEAKVSVLESKP